MSKELGAVHKLLPADGEIGDFFGVSVDVSGHTAVVGATVDDNHAGSAYVFVRSGTVWSQQAKLLGSGTTSHFGLSVAVSGDTAVVGGGDDDEVGGVRRGVGVRARRHQLVPAGQDAAVRRSAG